MTGEIVAVILDKGYGFIAPAGSTDDNDMFFHMSALGNDLEWNEQLMGRRVEFELERQASQKRARAINVRAAVD